MDLSILIPARNEMFLGRTIQDILEHIEADTEIIAALDGYWPDVGIPQHERLTLLHFPESIGQRAATNAAARAARGKYVMKVDAHCAFDQGFDRVMIEDMQDDITMAPLMRNLHAFDWVCPDGHRRYQGPSGPCQAEIVERDPDGIESKRTCGKPTTMDVVWIAKPSPQSTAYRFDKTLHFQYHAEQRKKPGYDLGIIVGYDLSFVPGSVPLGVIELFTHLAGSHPLSSSRNNLRSWKNVTFNTMGLSAIDNGGGERALEIDRIGNEFKVEGIATPPVFADMIYDGDILPSAARDGSDKPSVEYSVCECFLPEIGTPSISGSIKSPLPIPATGDIVDSDVIHQIDSLIGGHFVYSENTSSFHNGSVTLKPVYNKDLVETMSLQGSCFMMARKRYFELNICDESWGSWGQQGVEVAVKSWLSGGRVLVNKRTWYSHMFRTQGGDFSFPYPITGSQVDHARKTSRKILQGDRWDKAVHPFQWLLDKFAPVPDWHEQPSKAIIYYTCNTHRPEIDEKCREQLAKAGLPIVAVSLNKELDFGSERITMQGERSPLTMHKQILAGLQKCQAEYVFLAESDVLYHPSHFEFTPARKDVFYFNTNVWKIRYPDGHAVWTDDLQQLSGMCGSRELFIDFFSKRIEQIEKEGFNRHYEPSARQNIYPRERGGKHGQENWQSAVCNVCIRHNGTLTKAKWSPDEYRDKQFAKGWKEADEVPGWGRIDGSYFEPELEKVIGG